MDEHRAPTRAHNLGGVRAGGETAVPSIALPVFDSVDPVEGSLASRFQDYDQGVGAARTTERTKLERLLGVAFELEPPLIIRRYPAHSEQPGAFNPGPPPEAFPATSQFWSTN
jgi:hypothetical protein